MIKVSVIIPVYNAERHLRECLESLRNQTLREIEMICVNDGSTDSSLQILTEYKQKDSRFHIAAGTHKGGGAARNLGMSQVAGEYIAFLDADDFMDRACLEKLYDQSKSVDADMTICSVRFLHQATGALTDEVAGLRIDNLPEKEVFCYKDMTNTIFNTFHNWPWNKMFKRSFLEGKKIQFQEILRTNDLLFTNKALIEAERITVVKDYCVTYRVDQDGDNCQSTNQVQLYGFYEAFLALKKYLIEKQLYEELKQSFINHALDGCIANLNSLEFGEGHQELFERLKSEIFAALDVVDQPDDYFYAYNHESQAVFRYRQMQKDYLSYILFRAEELSEFSREAHHERYRVGRYIDDINRNMQCEFAIFQQEIYELKNERIRFEHEVYRSFSYRIGSKLTKIPRWIYRRVKRG